MGVRRLHRGAARQLAIRLFELRAFIRPMTAVALHVPEQTRYTGQSSAQAWIEANDRLRRDILARLRDAGPLPSRDLPDTSQVPRGRPAGRTTGT